jgi:hypothetical protein
MSGRDNTMSARADSVPNNFNPHDTVSRSRDPLSARADQVSRSGNRVWPCRNKLPDNGDQMSGCGVKVSTCAHTVHDRTDGVSTCFD